MPIASMLVLPNHKLGSWCRIPAGSMSHTLSNSATEVWELALRLTETDPCRTREAIDKAHRKQMDGCDKGTLLAWFPQAKRRGWVGMGFPRAGSDAGGRRGFVAHSIAASLRRDKSIAT
jgi:hypothetical protein